MRELLPRVYTAAADLKRKVFIIDEVQRIKEGWDVLLKTLEEPPPDVLFIFCTTDPSGIRPAVVIALQRFTFRPLPESQIGASCGGSRKPKAAPSTDDALDLISQRAAGGMRDAESMLDQVISSGAETIDADAVRDLLGLADLETVERFIDALAGGDRARRNSAAGSASKATAAIWSPSPTRSLLACVSSSWNRSARAIGRPIDPLAWLVPPVASPDWTSTGAPPEATDSNSSWRFWSRAR